MNQFLLAIEAALLSLYLADNVFSTFKLTNRKPFNCKVCLPFYVALGCYYLPAAIVDPLLFAGLVCALTLIIDQLWNLLPF